MKTFDPSAYSALARRTAAEGCVLLRNDGPVLPFSEGAKVAAAASSTTTSPAPAPAAL